ncbi:hypothetical protein BDZ94DRAFT_1278429, partial [Collybia nuda]
IITFHHTPKACEVPEHLLAYKAATRYEVAHRAHRITTLAKARANAVDDMTEDWSKLASKKEYIGSHFLPLYERGKQITPSHLKGGAWIGKERHAPIGAYRQRFLKERETYLCNCGISKETVDHVFRHCPNHVRREHPRRKLALIWVCNFLHDNPLAFGVFREPRVD